MRRLLRWFLAPLVKIATGDSLCEWHICDDEAGRLLIVIIDSFGQSYALPQTADEFRRMARTINEMADDAEVRDG